MKANNRNPHTISKWLIKAAVRLYVSAETFVKVIPTVMISGSFGVSNHMEHSPKPGLLSLIRCQHDITNEVVI